MRKSAALLLVALFRATTVSLMTPASAFTTSHVSAPRRSTTRVDATTSTSTTTTTTDVPQPTSNSVLDNNHNDIILYDGVCNFCNTWVDLLLRLDVERKFRFAPLQSRVGQQLLVSIGKEADDISSVVLIQKQNKRAGEEAVVVSYYDKSRCVLKVVEELGPVAALASRAALAAVPESIRDGIYDTVAENRYNFMGKRDECRCSDPQFADRFLLD